MSLISVGTMAFDAIETPFGKVDRIIGGSATYVAYAAANFIKPIYQISIVGNDFPQEELDELTSRGVELDGVEIVKDKKSFFWSGKYHMDMNTRDNACNRPQCTGRFQSHSTGCLSGRGIPDAR